MTFASFSASCWCSPTSRRGRRRGRRSRNLEPRPGAASRRACRVTWGEGSRAVTRASAEKSSRRPRPRLRAGCRRVTQRQPRRGGLARAHGGFTWGVHTWGVHGARRIPAQRCDAEPAAPPPGWRSPRQPRCVPSRSPRTLCAAQQQQPWRATVAAQEAQVHAAKRTTTARNENAGRRARGALKKN